MLKSKEEDYSHSYYITVTAVCSCVGEFLLTKGRDYYNLTEACPVFIHFVSAHKALENEKNFLFNLRKFFLRAACGYWVLRNFFFLKHEIKEMKNFIDEH